MLFRVALLVMVSLTSVHGAKSPIPVGIALRLGDKFNTTVAKFRNGIETAQVLFEHTHPDIKFELIDFPHDQQLASVVAVADKIIESHVPAVIGPEMSTEALVLGETLNGKNIVLMSPSATSPVVTKDRPMVFRACFSDEQVADSLARYTLQKLKPKTIGVLHNISTPYSDFLSKRYVETIENELKGTQPRPAVFVQKALKQAGDYSKQIDAFKANGVTHLAIFDCDTDFQSFVLQSSGKEFFPFYIGSDCWGANEYVYENLVKRSFAGSKFEGIRIVYWKDSLESKLISDFKKEYRKLFKGEPNAWHASGFDAAWILFTAMAKAKNPKDGNSIRQALLALKDIPAVTTNKFTFGPNNTPKKPLYLYRINYDGVYYETTIQ